MIQKFVFGMTELAVWNAKDPHGRVALSIQEPMGGKSAACGMSPDDALALSAALERAAFIQRRVAAEVAAAKAKLAEQVRDGVQIAVVRVG